MSLSNFSMHAVGRLGQDCTVRQSGEYNVLSFSIANSEQRKGKDNAVQWLNFSYFTKSDKIAPYLTKGKLISVVSDWFEVREKDGKSYHNFRVRDINPFLEKNTPSNNAEPDAKTATNANPFDEDDDLPF